MKAQDIQLKVLLEDGLTPSEAAESLGLEPEVVHHRIMLNPVLQNCAREKGVAESDKEVIERLMRGSLSLATRTLQQVMQCSENDSARLKAAMYVLDKLAPQVSGGDQHNTQVNVQIDARRQERAEKRARLTEKAKSGVKELPEGRRPLEVSISQLTGIAV